LEVCKGIVSLAASVIIVLRSHDAECFVGQLGMMREQLLSGHFDF